MPDGWSSGTDGRRIAWHLDYRDCHPLGSLNIGVVVPVACLFEQRDTDPEIGASR